MSSVYGRRHRASLVARLTKYFGDGDGNSSGAEHARLVVDGVARRACHLFFNLPGPIQRVGDLANEFFFTDRHSRLFWTSKNWTIVPRWLTKRCLRFQNASAINHSRGTLGFQSDDSQISLTPLYERIVRG